MISLLAPSKTMDFDSKIPFNVAITSPLFEQESEVLRRKIVSLNKKDLKILMHVSDDLTDKIHALYQNPGPKKAALWAYIGDVYKGLQAKDFTQSETEWAQRHLFIMSGLYGLVRPYDEIQGYRLEMKAALKIGKNNNLYEFWGSKLADHIVETGETTICCVSSNEYAKAALAHVPKSIRVITPVFVDRKPNGKDGTVPIYSKIMRGVFAHWMIKHHIDNPDDLVSFSDQGYEYSEKFSKEDFPAFYRKKMIPLRFK